MIDFLENYEKNFVKIQHDYRRCSFVHVKNSSNLRSNPSYKYVEQLAFK